MSRLKRVGDVALGKSTSLIENLISFVIAVQIIKDRSENNSPVSKDEWAACASLAVVLYALDCFTNYYLLPNQKTDETNPETITPESEPLLPSETNTNSSYSLKTMASANILLGGFSQTILDFSGLASGLYGIWKNPEGFGQQAGYFACLSFFLLIGIAHGIVEGAGTRGQAMRKAGILKLGNQKTPAQHPTLYRFLNIITPIAPAFTTISYYVCSINSFANLMKFYLNDRMSTTTIYFVANAIGLLLVLPNLLMDYLVVMSKVLYTYATAGFSKEYKLLGEKTALASTLTWLHDNTYFALYQKCCNQMNDEHLYAASLWLGKMATRVFTVSGFFYNLMQIVEADKHTLSAKNYSSFIFLLPVSLMLLAALSAHLQFRSYSLAPALHIKKKMLFNNHAVDANASPFFAEFSRNLYEKIKMGADQDTPHIFPAAQLSVV